MIFLLLVLLFIMLLIAYFLNGYELISPWVISIIMFIISVSVVILNYNYWQVDIQPYTVIVIVFALLFLGIGETLMRYVLIQAKPKRNTIILSNVKEIKISFLAIIFILIYMIIVTYFYFKKIYDLSLLMGNTGGIKSMLEYARIAMVSPNIDFNFNFFVSQGLILSQCLTYFFIYVFLYNTVFIGFKLKNFIYLFPIIIYSTQIILSTSRTPFVRIVPFFLLLFFIFWKKKNGWSPKANVKIIKYSFITFIVFVFAFYFLGYFTNKINDSLWNTISIYVGSSIVTLNIYLQSSPIRDFFGKETLYGIFNILRKLNFNIPNYKLQLEFVSWNSGHFSSNVYTSLRRYIQDYTFGGMLVIMFLIGSLYGGFLHKIKNNSRIGISILIYSMFFFPIIEIAIEERFFNIILTARTIYLLLYIYIIYWFFVTRKRRSVIKK